MPNISTTIQLLLRRPDESGYICVAIQLFLSMVSGQWSIKKIQT